MNDAVRSRLFERAAALLRPAESCIDIGPGIRPQTLLPCGHHICVEPHDEYADVLERQEFAVYRGTAIDVLPRLLPVDAIFMLDVIEHMDKDDGLAALEMAKARARQVVVFTPLGFRPQSYREGERDAWGMNGTAWQTHRSGWMPADFPGWGILHEPDFHVLGVGAFFAIWTRP